MNSFKRLRTIGACAALCALVGFSSATTAHAKDYITVWVARYGTVSRTNAPIYDTVAGKYIYCRTRRNQVLLLIGQHTAYYAVLMNNGNMGWIRKTDCRQSEFNLSATVPKPD